MLVWISERVSISLLLLRSLIMGIIRCNSSETLPPVLPNELQSCLLDVKPHGPGSCQCTPLLDIHCQGLRTIPEFLDNTGMTYNGIYMASQSITDVPQGTFAFLRVTKIVLSFNPIGDKLSSSALRGLEKLLRELYLGDCGIRSLPDGMVNGMEEMRHLHFWRNQIASIPATFFKDCANLQELIMWGNRLTEIDENSFAGLWKLRKLDLDRNLIADLRKDAFRHLSDLESIHLGENRITTLSSETFSFAKNLKILNLDRNRIAYIYPKAFDGLGNLLSLSLDHNNLTYIPVPILDNLRNLTVLSLHRNRLEAIWPKTFVTQRSLVRLNLSNNRLQSLPNDIFRSNPRLKLMYLDNNQIESFSRCLLARKIPAKTVTVISLIGNPISCDCQHSWIVGVFESRGLVVRGTCGGGGGGGGSSGLNLSFPLAISNRRNYAGCNETARNDCRLQW